MQRFLIIITIIFCSYNVFSQSFTFADTYPEKNVDSLDKWLRKNPKPSSVRLKNLIKYEHSFFFKDLLQGNKSVYYPEIETLSQKLQNKIGLASDYLIKSNYFFNKTNTKEASDLLLKALIIFESQNDYSGQLNVMLGLHSISLREHSDNNLTANYYMDKAKAILKKHPNEVDDFLLNSLLFYYYYSNNDFQQMIKISKYLRVLYNKYPRLGYHHRVITLIETGAGIRVKEYNNLEKSLQLYEEYKGLLPKESFADAMYFNRLADMYVEAKQFDKAIPLYRKAIKSTMKSKYKDYETLVHSYEAYQSIVKSELKDYKLALALGDTIADIKEKIFTQKNNSDAEQTEFRYNFEKTKLESLLLSKDILITEQQKKGLAKNLAFEKQKLIDDSLKNNLKLKQKELELIKINTVNQISELSLGKSKKENFFLYIILLGGLAFIGVLTYLIYSLRKAYRRLKFLNKSREKLMTIIAHDLRSPLNSYQQFSEIIMYLIKSNQFDKLDKVMIQMDETGLHFGALLDSLLAWSVEQQQYIQSTPTAINIQPFFDELLPIYYNMANLKGINLAKEIDEFSLKTDARILALIVRNLLDNAIKYTTNEQTIHLKAFVQNSQVIISVQNKSLMTDEKKVLIQEFCANINESEWINNGVGIGLSMVKHFAKTINTSIEFEYNQLNDCIFRVTIPC